MNRPCFSLISTLSLSMVTFTDVLAQPAPATPPKATCPVINSGDAVNFTGSYKLTPKQVITSP